MSGTPLIALRSALSRVPGRPKHWDPVTAGCFLLAILATQRDAGLQLYAGVLLMTVPLTWRRRAPMQAFVTQLIGIAVASNGVSTIAFFAVMVGAYSVAAYAPSTFWSLVLLLGSATWVAIAFGDATPPMPHWLTSFALVVPVWLTGVQARRWRLAAHQADEHARTARLAGELAAQQALAQQKAHIAREMHDVISHNVSVMVVQAAAARQVLDSEPAFALAALAAIEKVGQEAMADLRHILAVLRDPKESDVDLRPQSSWEQVEDLVDRVRAAGLAVTTTTTGVPRALSPGLGLVAYRVVQEALTNVLRHAKGSTAQVSIDYGDRGLVLLVSNTAPLEPDARVTRSAPGRGLLGLAERVRSVEGELEAGPRIDGGYRVRAHLPSVQP